MIFSQFSNASGDYLVFKYYISVSNWFVFYKVTSYSLQYLNRLGSSKQNKTHMDVLESIVAVGTYESQLARIPLRHLLKYESNIYVKMTEAAICSGIP